MPGKSTSTSNKTKAIPQFRNIVFEGGGVKGIAYIGALEVLEKQGALKHITRVGGTSAGAITALFYALGYSIAAQKLLIASVDFSKFMDDSIGYIRDIHRLAHDFGWYRGDFFLSWIGDAIENALGSRTATFNDLIARGLPQLYVVGTNLSTQTTDIFSHETHPDMPLAQAVRISMSIPLFFAAVRYGPHKNVYVDGGVLSNYPVKIFDEERFIDMKNEAGAARKTEYYTRLNTRACAENTHCIRRIYNKQTIGFRVDSHREIEYFHHHPTPAHHARITSFTDYATALLTAFSRVQERQHLHSDDWERTIYIDTQDISALDFDLKEETKQVLLEAGKTSAEKYFTWFNASESTPDNRI